MDSISPFNLIDEPWLPVRRRSGVVEHIPPWRVVDRINEDPFTGFAWSRPDFNGAAHEFLIGLLSTATAPMDYDEWEEWWVTPPSPKVLRERFNTIAHAFDLGGSGPRFLQDLDPLEDAKSKEVATLLIDSPGEETEKKNTDLFVKRGSTSALARSAAAMALFTLNCYAPSGGKGYRTSLRGGGPMTTLVVADHSSFGSTLWGRLWPNVETREQIESRSTEAELNDDAGTIFPWLAPTRTSAEADGRSTTSADVHPLQVYWGMPRRIRLEFEKAGERLCSLTNIKDTVVVAKYRTRTYGINYAEGFQHPLTPYYRQNANKVVWLPVHPSLSGISYRLWPGLVVSSGDGLRKPARVVIRRWPLQGNRNQETRFSAFGYDMDKGKARNWIEGEMPLLQIDGDIGERLGDFIRKVTAGADRVTRLVTDAVKSALYDRPKDTKGDYNFIGERFYRDTEAEFYTALENAKALIERNPDADDPTMEARESWVPVMGKAALRLFDEYASSEGLGDRNMYRHVKARFCLLLALRGSGSKGKSLFEKNLEIPSPITTQSRQLDQEAT